MSTSVVLKENFLSVAEELELAGLVWKPEIGDEICFRQEKSAVSVLVDPQGLSPGELRATYLWLPTVEQMVWQFEARSAILEHTGLELTSSSICYRTVIKSSFGEIESKAISLRASVGMALRNLLISASPTVVN
jgi:hypothetical protein